MNPVNTGCTIHGYFIGYIYYMSGSINESTQLFLLEINSSHLKIGMLLFMGMLINPSYYWLDEFIPYMESCEFRVSNLNGSHNNMLHCFIFTKVLPRVDLVLNEVTCIGLPYTSAEKKNPG